MPDTLSPVTINSEEDNIVFERISGDHISPDNYWAFQPVLVTDIDGRRVHAWLRRYGGPRNSRLSLLGKPLIAAGIIDPASAVF